MDACRSTIHTRFGNDPQTSDSYCRMINERRFDALQKFLDDIDPKQIVVGGKTDRKDLYIAPTVVGPVASSGHPLMEQEIFGPILPIVPVEDMNEAIHIVNSKDTPLALYIFTDDKATRNKSKYSRCLTALLLVRVANTHIAISLERNPIWWRRGQ